MFYEYRRFGIASNMLFGYPIAQGILLSFSLFYSLKNKVYIIFIPIILFSIMLNARIGFLPIVLSIIIMLFSAKKILHILIPSVIFVILTITLFMNSDYGQDLTANIDWVTQAFEETKALFNSNNSEARTYNILRNMIVLPDNIIDWIFGTQEYIFGEIKDGSDIGYILQLNYAGLIMILFFVILYLRIGKKLTKIKIQDIGIPFLLTLTALIANIKGDFLTPNPAVRLIILLYVYYVINNYSKLKKDEKNSYSNSGNSNCHL